MSVYLVTYDGDKSGMDMEKTREVLHRFPHSRFGDMAFLIDSDRKAEEIWEAFTPAVEQDDRLLVLTISSTWWGRSANNEIIHWLEERLW